MPGDLGGGASHGKTTRLHVPGENRARADEGRSAHGEHRGTTRWCEVRSAAEAAGRDDVSGVFRKRREREADVSSCFPGGGFCLFVPTRLHSLPPEPLLFLLRFRGHHDPARARAVPYRERGEVA